MDTRNRLGTVWNTVRELLLHRRSKQLGVFLVFVVLATCFWLVQTLNETFHTDLRFALRLDNVPQGVIVTTDLPSQVVVHVTDRGTELADYFPNSGSTCIALDFADYDNGRDHGHVIVAKDWVEAQVKELLNASTTIDGIEPDTLEFFYTRGTSRKIPVVHRGQVTLDELHYLVGVTCEPDSVTIWADRRTLDTLRAVYTTTCNFEDISEDAMQHAQLSALRGVKMVPNEVDVTALVDMYTEKTITGVPIQSINFPAGVVLRTFPSRADVTFRVGTKDFNRYSSENFVLAATYEELLGMSDSVYPLHLRSIPEGVSQVRIRPATVQFLIERTEAESIEEL